MTDPTPRGIRLHEVAPPTAIPGWDAIISAMPTEPSGIGSALAVAEPVSGEVVTREARAQVLVEEVRGLLRMEIQTRVRQGQCLRELRGLVDGARYTEALDVIGITADTATRIERVAAAVEAMPALSDLAERKWTAVLALVQAADVRDLPALTAPDGPVPLDEIPQLGIRELRSRLRRLQADVGAQVRAETKVLIRERDAALKEAERLRAEVDPTWSALRDGTARLRTAAAKLGDEVRLLTLALTHIEGDDPVTRTALESAIRDASELFRALWSQYQERAANDWPDADLAD